jgi:twinfilin-like protein
MRNNQLKRPEIGRIKQLLTLLLTKDSGLKMARANLHVKQEVIDEFLNAQETRNVRIIKVRIIGEEMLLDGTFIRQGSAQEDFNGLLKDSLNETEASFLLFCSTDDEKGSLSWILIAWVPDGCRVRDKMLYSSSREDLKYSLGLGYFKSEYGTNSLSDINWEIYEKSLKVDFDPSILTETERLVLEEKVCVSLRLRSSPPPFFFLVIRC